MGKFRVGGKLGEGRPVAGVARGGCASARGRVGWRRREGAAAREGRLTAAGAGRGGRSLAPAPAHALALIRRRIARREGIDRALLDYAVVRRRILLLWRHGQAA